MAATIELTSASSNMESYLSSWSSGFTSNYGAFWSSSTGLVTNPSGTDTYTAWGAGQTGSKGVVLEGSMQYTQGDLTGDVNSVVLGTGYSQSGAGIAVSQEELFITPEDNDPTSTFDYAIYDLTVNGSIGGLYNYLASVGTVIEDTSSSDVLVGFGGADTFVFSGGSDTVKAGGTGTAGYQDGTDKLDVSAWGALNFAYLDISDDGNGNALVESWIGPEQFVLEGVDYTDLDSSDFLFA